MCEAFLACGPFHVPYFFADFDAGAAFFSTAGAPAAGVGVLVSVFSLVLCHA